MHGTNDCAWRLLPEATTERWNEPAAYTISYPEHRTRLLGVLSPLLQQRSDWFHPGHSESNDEVYPRIVGWP